MKRSKSSGFTLVELLAVIVILSLLVALLLPAIGAAVRRANEASVTAEMNVLASSLAAFKSDFVEVPPSRIILAEDGDYSPTKLAYTTYSFATPNAVDQNNGAIAQRSINYLRRFWPRLPLSLSGPTRGPGSAAYLAGDKTWMDYNGNGKLDAPVVLTGDECLVFFLGGVPEQVTTGNTTAWGATGFARYPTNPFISGVAMANSRTKPYFEFRNDRLVDIDGDGYPSYVDALNNGKIYAYFSSYGGSGYDCNDVNFDIGHKFVESDEAATTSPIMLAFRVNFPTASGTSAGGYYTAKSPSPNPYTVTPTNLPSSGPIYINSQSHQIISAGVDGLYGIGGMYAKDAEVPLPVDPANTTPSTDSQIRIREKDDLTSFATGRLD
jgi:prepilin-type N-terminal cleavage/methylation domain-containing protein